MLTKLINRYIRPYGSLLAGVLVFQLIATAASLSLPSLNARIIDNGVAKGDTDYILRNGAIMLSVSLVQAVSQIIAVYFGAKAAMSFGRDVRGAVFERTLSFSTRELNQFGAPSLITRTTNDVQQVQMLVMMTCTMMISAPITMVGGVFMALREDLVLSWLILVAVVLLGSVIGVLVWRMTPLFQLNQVKIDTINRVVREQITGIRVIRAFTREPLERKRFDQANGDIMRLAFTIGTLFAVLFPFVMFVMNMGSVGVMWFGGMRIDAGDMQIGQLTAFLQYLMQILISVMMSTMMLMMAPRAAVCANRIMEVLNTSSSVAPPTAPVTELPEHGTVRFEDVEFAYPGADAPVLVGSQLRAASRPDHRGGRLNRVGQVDVGQPDPATVRRDRRTRPGGWCRRPRDRPRPAVEPDRPGAAASLSVQRHREVEHGLRRPGRVRRTDLAGLADRASLRLRNRDGRRT